MAITFALYLGTVSIVQDLVSIHLSVKICIFCVSQIIWLLPWSLALFCHGPVVLNIGEDKDTKNVNEVLIIFEEEEAYNIGMPQIFATIEFWLLFLPFILTSGC